MPLGTPPKPAPATEPMSLNESHVEEAALEWFGELGYAVGHGPQLAPGEPAAERRVKGRPDQWPSFTRHNM